MASKGGEPVMSRNQIIILAVVVIVILTAAAATVFSQRNALQTRVQQGIGSTTRTNEF